MKHATRVLIYFATVLLLPQLPALFAQQDDANYSRARIVRLSFTEGTVTVQRPGDSEWAKSPVNTPIQEGFKVATGDSSFAEVQFENASTVRLGEGSLLKFTELSISPEGSKVNRMALDQGYATFTIYPEHSDVYEIQAAGATMAARADKKAQFRADLDSGALRVEVFKGTVDVSSSYGAETLTKDMVLEIQPDAQQPMAVSNGITSDAWDDWVNQRESQAQSALSSSPPMTYSPAADASYGWNDLSDYGVWNYLPYYGYGWTPIVGAGWSPFTYGQWCFYPGMGYTWIPMEPWGWLPYHYGGWEFVTGLGWTWIPGSSWIWSPAPVVWYQGSGWVGWAPRAPGSGPTQATSCPAGQHCVVRVSPVTLQNGKPIMKETILSGKLGAGQLIGRPNLPPTQLGMLPGPAAPRPVMSIFASRGLEGGRTPGSPVTSNGNTKVVVIGSPSGAAPASTRRAADGTLGPNARPGNSGIAFDSSKGRYVNGNVASPAESKTGAGAFGAAEAKPAPTEISPAASPEFPSAGIGRAGAETRSGNSPAAPRSPFHLWGGRSSPNPSGNPGAKSGGAGRSGGGWGGASRSSGGFGGSAGGFGGGGHAAGASSGGSHGGGGGGGGHPH